MLPTCVIKIIINSLLKVPHTYTITNTVAVRHLADIFDKMNITGSCTNISFADNHCYEEAVLYEYNI
jgi:hypothetical protein